VGQFIGIIFDIIIMMDVIENSKESVWVLRKIQKLFAPDDLLVLTTTDRDL